MTELITPRNMGNVVDGVLKGQTGEVKRPKPNITLDVQVTEVQIPPGTAVVIQKPSAESAEVSIYQRRPDQE